MKTIDIRLRECKDIYYNDTLLADVQREIILSPKERRQYLQAVLVYGNTNIDRQQINKATGYVGTTQSMVVVGN